MSEALQALDSVRLNFSQEGLLVLNLTLAFIMFGVALEIKPEHFKNVFVQKLPPILGFISQFLVLPLLTFVLVLALNKIITPTIALGMILVAACPGGNISNFISSLAKGNAALSVTLTAIATLSAIVLTPLNFLFWGRMYVKIITRIDASEFLRPIEIDPFQVFQSVFILLGIPLIAGMLVNHFFPKFTSKVTRPIKTLSIILFALIVVLTFKKNYDYFLRYIQYIFIIVLIHNALGLSTGYYFSNFFRIGKRNKRTIAIETGIQNSGLALVLLFNPNVFPEELANGGMAFIAAWWGIWHILSGLGLAGYWSLRPPKD